MRKLKKDSFWSMPRCIIVMLGCVVLVMVALILPRQLNMPATTETATQPTKHVVAQKEVVATPQAIRIAAIDIDQEIKAWSSNEPVNPEAWWDIVWWTAGGHPNAKAASAANLTTFLFGHSTNNLDRKVVFDDLDLLKAGDQIQLTTDLGEFDYQVVDSFIVKKDEFTSDPRVTKNEEGRLLLVSCWTESQYNTGIASQNIVVVAKLQSLLP